MSEANDPHSTARERVLRAWENSAELARQYRSYARESAQDERLSRLFSEYAQSEARRAARLRAILQDYER